MQKTHTHIHSFPCHRNAHMLSLNWGGKCWSHPPSKLAQCITKPELIHILSLALCFIVRHTFCYSHQGDKRQQSHASSCSPLLLRLCAGSCFADQWMGSSSGHKAPQIKRERKQRGIGITSFRWPSTNTQGGKMSSSVEKKTLKG